MKPYKHKFNTFEKKPADKNIEISSFFEIPPVKYGLEIYDTQEDLAKSWVEHSDNPDAKTPSWIVAFATLGGTIHLLSPEIMPPGHEKTGHDRFKKTLKHELSHLYVDQINKSAPSWLKEGVCLHVAEQDYYKKFDLDLITISMLNELDFTFTDGRAYNVGKTVVDLIIDNFGKQKLFEIIGITDKNERYDELKNMFSWF